MATSYYLFSFKGKCKGQFSAYELAEPIHARVGGILIFATSLPHAKELFWWTVQQGVIG